MHVVHVSQVNTRSLLLFLLPTKYHRGQKLAKLIIFGLLVSLAFCELIIFEF